MPDAPFQAQQVLVTVPASFDAVARELTLDAARQAGYENITLLEEPQAAFYAWLERHPDWRQRVAGGDIGGGTTDFTLIAVTEANGELSLSRVAVGEHILLGGDNVDLALAGVVALRLAEKGTKIDSRQHLALWANCRVAKEKLLEPGAKAKEQAVTILGKGTGLVGGTVKAMLLASDIEQVLGAGFLPAVASTEMPAHQRRAGLQELGLPYAADPPITRHMARFLPIGRCLSQASCRRLRARRCPRTSGAPDFRSSACPTPPTPRSRATWRAFCDSRRPPRNTARCGADRAVWPARPTSCSTAACSTPIWCANAFSPHSTRGWPN